MMIVFYILICLACVSSLLSLVVLIFLANFLVRFTEENPFQAFLNQPVPTFSDKLKNEDDAFQQKIQDAEKEKIS